MSKKEIAGFGASGRNGGWWSGKFPVPPARFKGAGIHTIRTPIQVPQANVIAERFVRTFCAECLDWLFILSARHLYRLLLAFTKHYNQDLTETFMQVAVA